MSWLHPPIPQTLIDPADALKGGSTPVNDNPQPHGVLGTPVTGPWKESQKSIILGIGCFWGAEKLFWNLDGVESTSVGYAGGYTANPTYREVCTGRTGHTEVVEVVYDPTTITLQKIIEVALTNHDPTQGYRQGNDIGTQYRSAFYTTGGPANALDEAELIRGWVAEYGKQLAKQGFGPLTTEIFPLAETPSGMYYLAEDYHQQYLHKNPEGYCPHHGTGVVCRLDGPELH